MAIDWKTIISEFDGKPTLLQAIGKLRKAVEEETITIQQAQAEIAKLEAQQKTDEALINTKQDKLNDKSDVTVLYLTATNGINAGTVKAHEVSDDEDNVYNFPKKAGTFALTEDVTAVDTKAQNALDLATTNETDISTLDGQVAVLETNLSNKQDKITKNTELSLKEIQLDSLSYTIEIGSNSNEYDYGILFASKNVVSTGQIKPSFVDETFFEWVLPAKSGTLATTGDIKTGITIQDVDADDVGFAKKIRFSIGYETPTVGGNGEFTMPNPKLKTLFGNQSIVGTGNIDLYHHYVAVAINGVRYPLHIDFYSSNSLECDSLTDLKTLLGDTFERALFGSATTGANGSFFGNFLSNSGAHGIIVGSSGVSEKYYTWSDITITDTVTTI